MKGIRLLTILLIMLLPVSLSAQERKNDPAKDEDQQEELEQRIEELEKQIAELMKKIEEAEQEDEMKKLLEEADRLSKEHKEESQPPEDRKFYSGLRQHSALNPNISVGGNFYYAQGSSDSDYNTEPSLTDYGTGRFVLKEVELAFESVLDPYSRGKAYIGVSEEGADVEEGYFELLNLPLNINLKLGKFKTQFGEINRYHCHALPQLDRPRVMLNFFGEGGLNGVGAGMNILLPSFIAHVNELDLQLISGGSGLSFTDEGKTDMIGVARFKNFWDLSRSTYLELGLSGALGHNDPEQEQLTTIGGVDLRIRWTPPERAKYREFLWWTEALVSRRDTETGYVDSWGIFSIVQNRFGARLVGGIRLDYSRLPQDNSSEEYGGTVNLDFWQSEFVFFRLQYSYIKRNFDENDNRVIVQSVWAMGPHKHEAY